MQLQINATTRPPANNRALRRGGQIPATVYGHKGAESISIALDAKEATTLLREATINNTMIEVNVTDGDFKGKTLLREVQNHPYKNDIYHLSFFCDRGSVEDRSRHSFALRRRTCRRKSWRWLRGHNQELCTCILRSKQYP